MPDATLARLIMPTAVVGRKGITRSNVTVAERRLDKAFTPHPAILCS
ncbi:hypothetical protein ACLK11_22990 [Escherichia coli]